MDQDTLIDGLTNQLDFLEKVVYSAVLLAAAALWAGVHNSPEIEAIGITFKRRHAFVAVASIYILANYILLNIFVRIGALMSILDDGHVVKGVTTLATHGFFLNPFAYFGLSPLARLYTCSGFGFLVALWWVCNASLASLRDRSAGETKQSLMLLGVFLAIGLATILAINDVYATVLTRLQTVNPILRADVRTTEGERTIAVFLGIGVGAALFSKVDRLTKPSLDSKT